AAREAGLNVWAYSGYTYEEIQRNPAMRALLSKVDVLVDGRFVLAERSLSLRFRGSRNQRLIDVPKSLESGTVVQLPDK
ncbi:MAG: radical SAM protein, partial [Clostridiales bacterium]|nr:radical SAM protein [Clostridiales bacterium]